MPVASTDRFALVVEDSDDIARLVQLMLRRMNIESAHAANGFAALAFLEERLPDLVLLDINMPGMNGWQVLETIKERHAQADFPVIVLTALNDPTNRLIGKLQPQVFCYVTKPFELDALALAVREALGLTPGEG
ncbi:MAG: response regulator [Chloroflexi bacterium]|nr:response regulator [Chloroflexota bacterium]